MISFLGYLSWTYGYTVMVGPKIVIFGYFVPPQFGNILIMTLVL